MIKLSSAPLLLLIVLGIRFHAQAGPSLPLPAKNFKVVLDPGHGGADSGATVKATRTDPASMFTEKDAVLKLALETQRQLKAKGYPVILTRDKDVELALTERTAIANRAKAQLFISLHMNSVEGRTNAEGVETYFLSSTSDENSKRLAELENKGIDPTQGSKKAEETEVNLILKDMTLDANLPESKRLACALQKHLTSVTQQKTRGVKQALFVVLLGADMPTSLVEAGFVTSAKDRRMISSDHGLRAMATSMVRAIDQFRLRQGSALARQDLASCLVSEQ